MKKHKKFNCGRMQIDLYLVSNFFGFGFGFERVINIIEEDTDESERWWFGKIFLGPVIIGLGAPHRMFRFR